MKIEEVKKNLGKAVMYKGSDRYKLTACTIRKGKDGLFYQAEVLDLSCGTSVIICKLDEVEAIE